MTTNSEDEIRFGMNMQRFKALGIIDPRSKQAMDAFDHHEFSSAERLFFKLWGSDLNSGVFQPGQKIAQRGDHATFAHVVISGTVETVDNQGKKLCFGPGSVFGMAEGLADIVYAWDAVARTVVTTKLIPLDRALREVRRLNSGLKGICRFTTMRILELKAPPATLS